MSGGYLRRYPSRSAPHRPLCPATNRGSKCSRRYCGDYPRWAHIARRPGMSRCWRWNREPAFGCTGPSPGGLSLTSA